MNPVDRSWREDCRDSEGRPLSHDHERAMSPFIERAESADIGTEALVHPASYRAAVDHVGGRDMPVRHARRRLDWWAIAGCLAGFAAAVVIIFLVAGGAR